MALGGCTSVRVVESDVQSFTASATGAAAAVALGSSFRFERLPSQGMAVPSMPTPSIAAAPAAAQVAAPSAASPSAAAPSSGPAAPSAGPAAAPSNPALPADPQARIEALAQAALHKVGLQRNDAAARYSVQATARTQGYYADAWGNPWPGYSGGLAGGWLGQVSLGVGIGGHSGGIWLGYPLGMGGRDLPRLAYQHEVSLLLRDLRTQQVVYETRASGNGPWGDADAIWAALFDAALQGFPNPPQGLRRIRSEIAR